MLRATVPLKIAWDPETLRKPLNRTCETNANVGLNTWGRNGKVKEARPRHYRAIQDSLAGVKREVVLLIAPVANQMSEKFPGEDYGRP